MSDDPTMFDVEPMSWEETAQRVQVQNIALHDEIERLKRLLDQRGKDAADAEDEVERLREAEAHLWALVVWFGGRYDHPAIDRDMQAAARYVNRHLSGEDMTARHRAVMADSAP